MYTQYIFSKIKVSHFEKYKVKGQIRVLTILDVCSQKSSGHKAVKFGRNIYLHWDYNPTEIIQS
jgi:hypothetical protein